MANYLNAFYGATNGFCGVMTSVMYANEIQGQNLISQNNKLLDKGFTYHLGSHQRMMISGLANRRVPTGVCAVEGTNNQYYVHVCGSWTYDGGSPEHFDWYVGRKSLLNQIEAARAILSKDNIGLPGWFPSPSKLKMSPTLSNTNEIVAAYNYMVQKGYVAEGHSYSPGPTCISSPTISQLVNYEASIAKTASANTVKEWGQQVQAANTAFSNIKNQAQAGVSQVSGWVQTDGDEMTAAVNMLSSVLQGLASPVTVS